jgi:integral membrane sensor domain MASE1
MRMQEPEQWQSFEATETTGQEYSAYRAETGQNAQGQKVYPQETRKSRVSVLNIFTIVISSIGFGPAIIGIVGSGIVLHYRDGSPHLLTAGILGLVGSIVALLLFVAIFVLSVVSAARRAARYQRSRFR